MSPVECGGLRIETVCDRAGHILRDKQADLISVGPKFLNNSNCPVDVALKLGEEG